MKMDMFVISGLVLGAGCILTAFKMFRNATPGDQTAAGEGEGTEKPKLISTARVPTESERVKEHAHTLEVYSKLWKKNEDEKNTLRSLSKLWRNDVNDGLQLAPDKPMFVHSEIRHFFKEFVDGKPFFVGNGLLATVELLKLLDSKGKCPSVVNKREDEPERGYNKGVYKALKSIPLYRHTLHVAREITTMVTPGAMTRKAIIAALAHDVGKITQYYDKLHGTGIHAFVGVSILDRIEPLKALKFYDEIVDAVKNHHRNPEAQLGQILKKADQEARRKEILEYCSDEMDDDAAAAETKMEQENAEAVTPSSKPKKNKKGATSAKPAAATPVDEAEETTTGDEEETDIEQEEEPPVIRPPSPQTMSDLMGAGVDTQSTPADLFGEGACAPTAKELDLMGENPPQKTTRAQAIRKVKIPWFDVDAALNLLGVNVNQLQGGRWSSISMPEGTIYIRPELLFSAAETLSNNAPDIKIARGDEQTKDSIIFAMVSAFRKAGVIETTLVHESHYGAEFVINPGRPGSYNKYLVPFKAEAWKEIDISSFEKRKDIKTRAVQEIKLKSVVEAQ